MLPRPVPYKVRVLQCISRRNGGSSELTTPMSVETGLGGSILLVTNYSAKIVEIFKLQTNLWREIAIFADALSEMLI
jgi:hypothetical protein